MKRWALILLCACSKKTEPAAAVVAEPPKPDPVVVIEEKKAPPPAAAVVVPEAKAPEPQQQLVVIETPPPSPPKLDEASWRKRFKEAHARVDGFQQRLDAAQQIVSKADYATVVKLGSEMKPAEIPKEYEEAKRFVDHADEEKKAAETALEDLEREAANAAVPLEWRR